MNIGDKFEASIKIGWHISSATIIFDFVVDDVTKAGLVWATGTARELRSDGLKFQGTKKRKCRFKGNHEYQPDTGRGFSIT